jgi:hypothetical protein
MLQKSPYAVPCTLCDLSFKPGTQGAAGQ